MTDAPVLPALRGLPHFRLLDEELLARLAEGCRRRRLAAGEHLFGEGDTCRAFYAVVTGAVKVYRMSADGHEQVLHRLRSGQTFAEAALLNMGIYPANAIAVEPTELIEIGGQPFLTLFRENDRLATAMVGSLCAWLVKLVERVEDLAVVSAGARLARFLLRLPATESGGGLDVALPMSKKELAAHLSITPETLSRLLRRWKDRGILADDPRRITIRDPDLLTTIADREERT